MKKGILFFIMLLGIVTFSTPSTVFGWPTGSGWAGFTGAYGTIDSNGLGLFFYGAANVPLTILPWPPSDIFCGVASYDDPSELLAIGRDEFPFTPKEDNLYKGLCITTSVYGYGSNIGLLCVLPGDYDYALLQSYDYDQMAMKEDCDEVCVEKLKERLVEAMTKLSPE